MFHICCLRQLPEVGQPFQCSTGIPTFALAPLALSPLPLPAPPVQVVTLSKREMAALRSSLPSPNKYKGRQLAEKMGIKSSGQEEAVPAGSGTGRSAPDSCGWELRRACCGCAC